MQKQTICLPSCAVPGLRMLCHLPLRKAAGFQQEEGESSLFEGKHGKRRDRQTETEREVAKKGASTRRNIFGKRYFSESWARSGARKREGIFHGKPLYYKTATESQIGTPWSLAFKGFPLNSEYAPVTTARRRPKEQMEPITSSL